MFMLRSTGTVGIGNQTVIHIPNVHIGSPRPGTDHAVQWGKNCPAVFGKGREKTVRMLNTFPDFSDDFRFF